MKKRILSILLAVLMIVPMFTFATTVSAADETPWYSYEFEDRDIRNWVEGQVIDLGVTGEVAVAPVMDGDIGEDEYSVQTTMPRRSSTNAPASLPVWTAVKGQYLYIAFMNLSETAREDIQVDIGVMGTHTSEQVWNRINAGVSATGVINGGGCFLGHPTLSGYASANYTSPYGTDIIKEAAHADGVYEIKIDLAYVYNFFAGSLANKGIWDSPTISFFFWYDLDASGVGQSQYAPVCSSVKIDSERAVTHVGKTVIIPESSFNYIKDNFRATVGKFGYDVKNSAETQLATLDSYATVAPTMDGVVNPGEYTTSVVHKQDLLAAYGDFTGSYAVKDGYLYAAWSFEDASAKRFILQYGLVSHDWATMVSRTGQIIETTGAVTKNQNYLYKSPLAVSAFSGSTMGGAGQGAAQAISAAGYKHVDGVTTVEVRIALPHLVQSFKDCGWNAQNTNAVAFTIFPNASANIGFKVSDTVSNQIKKTTGINYAPGTKAVMPTVMLPKGCIDMYNVEDVDDFEAFGQKHLHAAPSVVALDGKIGAGEYTASETYNGLRTTDGKAEPDLTENVNVTNYFAYDADYIYLGAKVYDPNYKPGTSAYQFNLAVLNKKDGKVDLGDGVKRVNAMAKVNADGTFDQPTYNYVCRSQKVDNAYPDEARMKAAVLAAGGPQFAGSYDADTKTITYEIAIKIADLKSIFNVDEVESFNYLNYVAYGNGTNGYHFYKTNNAGGTRDAIKALTYIGNAGTINYDNDFFMHVVHLDSDAQTRQSASARISNTASGLRFKSHFTNEYLAYMANYAKAKGETMEIGTLIAPADYIKGEFTHAALGKGNYVEVMADLDTPFSNANGVTTIAGSLVNIKEANLDRDFAGIGFIKIGNEYFYTDSYTVKNVSAIASAALADTKAVAGNGYDYKVSEGVYSPYSEGQRNVLNTLIAK